MPDEHPPLGKYFCSGYDADDRDFPIVAVVKDSRPSRGYEPPVMLSACPDTAYPTHRLARVIQSDTDMRATWIYMILPGPIRTGSVMTGKKQSGTLTKQHVALTEGTITPSALIENASIEPIDSTFGDKSEVSIGSVLAMTHTGKRQEDVTPRKFKSITSIDTTEGSAAGTQSLTAMGSDGVGVISSQVSAEDAFQSRKSDTTVTGSVVTSLTEYAKNGDDQVVTLALSYGSSATSPTITSLTESARVEALGNGKFETVLGTVGELFDAKLFSDDSAIEYPLKYLAAGKDETEATVVAATTAVPDTISNTGTGILRASAQRISAVKVRKSKTTRSGTPTALEGFDYDEASGLLLPTLDVPVAAGTAGVTLQSDGTYAEVHPLNTAWSIKSTRTATGLPGPGSPRTYTTTRNVNLPRVLTLFEPVVFLDAGGDIRFADFQVALTDYSRDYTVTVNESWKSTPDTLTGPAALLPVGFSWITPYSRGAVPECLHGTITITGSTGTTDPVWGFIEWDYSYSATSPATLSGSTLVISDEQHPWRGGFLRRKESITIP